METFDLIITIGCLIVGFMMLTGRGDVLLNDKDAAQRNKLYDMLYKCQYCSKDSQKRKLELYRRKLEKLEEEMRHGAN